MEILENNKLIDEFMGLDKVDCDIDLWVIDGSGYPNGKLAYHKSWDWLMPVVHKIGGMDIDFEPLGSVSLYSSIDLVYSACVDFIKWYNKNKQS